MSCWHVVQVAPKGFPQVCMQLYFVGVHSSYPLTGVIPLLHIDAAFHDRFRRGWHTFCGEHGLLENCRVTFSCERRWVFSATAFHQGGTDMSFLWATVKRPWERLHPTPDIPANFLKYGRDLQAERNLYRHGKQHMDSSS